MEEYILEKQTGRAFSLLTGDRIEVIDLEGKQIADFFPVCTGDAEETFSAGITIARNHSLVPAPGQPLLSSRYRPMLTILEDNVGVHDLLISCCRRESYAPVDGRPHPNCLDNFNNSFAAFGIPPFPAIQALSIFMNVEISEGKAVKFRPPLSKPDDKMAFRAEMDLVVGVTACSDDLSVCNNRRCKPIKVSIHRAGC